MLPPKPYTAPAMTTCARRLQARLTHAISAPHALQAQWQSAAARCHRVPCRMHSSRTAPPRPPPAGLPSPPSPRGPPSLPHLYGRVERRQRLRQDGLALLLDGAGGGSGHVSLRAGGGVPGAGAGKTLTSTHKQGAASQACTRWPVDAQGHADATTYAGATPRFEPFWPTRGSAPALSFPAPASTPC